MGRCRSCGAALEQGDRFCGDCGTPLGGCPSCGAAVQPGKKYCRSCGCSLPGSAPLLALAARPDAAGTTGVSPGANGGGTVAPSTVAPGNDTIAAKVERRICSVLFCDIVEFTPLSESRDPEAVRELLSRYFDIARTIIGRYGGVPEKFIGDAVMAVWGAPRASESDAERAVRAGLDLVSAVSDLGSDTGIPGLTARVGVVTAEVAVTLGAVGEGMVAGGPVSTASRVQSVARPGCVWVDETTRRLCETAVGFDDAGSHDLKGKADPVRLWEATRVLSAAGGTRRTDGLEAPLIGRDAELRTIREFFHAAVDGNSLRMMLVCGPAGAGKSRLGWEFEKYTDGLADELWWHRGQCGGYGDETPLRALAQMIRQRLDIAENDSAADAASKLTAGLNRHIRDPEERDYAGIRLGRLLGAPYPKDSGAALPGEELFAGWRLFIERLAAVSPVIMLIEDAQHADAGLIGFLDHLADRSQGSAIFILLLARPEILLRHQGFCTGPNRATLVLEPLNPAAMNGLVDALVPGMPATARATVTAQAQGLPLFAVETVRSLIDQEIVTPVGGCYQLTGDIGDMVMPRTLHALLTARLDALPPVARRLASDASVLGTSFAPEPLAALTGQRPGAIQAPLADLVRREVLSPVADPLSPDQGKYRFTHPMLRQAAYDILSRRDRKARHLTAADYLKASTAGADSPDVIARHFLAALNAVPEDSDAPAIRRGAMLALIQAAEHAEHAGAPAAAAASYATAAELCGELVEPWTQRDGPRGGEDLRAGRLWERAAECMTVSNDAAGLEYAQRAREYYRRRGDSRGEARAQTAAARLLRYQGRLAQARALLTQAVAALRPDPDADTVWALYQLAVLEASAGSQQAGELSAEALILGQSLGVDGSALADLLVARGNVLTVVGRMAEAAAYYREAARLASRTGGSGQSQGIAELNLSDVLGSTDPAASAEAARAAVKHLRQAGAWTQELAIVNLTMALLMLGDWDGAQEELTRAADDPALKASELISCYQGWLAALRGDGETAAAALAGLDQMRAREDPQNTATIAVLSALIAAARGQPADALQHARSALGHADALGLGQESLRWAWPLAARAAHELGDTATTAELLAVLDGHRPGELPPMLRAERQLTRTRLAQGRAGSHPGDDYAAAIAAVRAQSTPYHLAHALLDFAEYLRDQGAAESAATTVAQAREISVSLACRPLLRRCDTIVSAVPAGN